MSTLTSTPNAPGAASSSGGYEFQRDTGYVLPEYPFVEPPELHSTEVVRHPVVIVGAGITGLTMACALARLGIQSIVLDEDNNVGLRGAASRGICYTQKSLEIFQRLGIYERVAGRGVPWSVGRTFAGDEELYAFDLRKQLHFGLSTQPPFINLQQFYIEGYLVERIAQLGLTDVRWKSRVASFGQSAGFATLVIDTPAGTYRMQADHVIDASGPNSPFHAWCGVNMQSWRGDDRWCVVDVRFKNRPPAERLTWIEAPFNDNRAVWQHLMADDVWRIDYQMEPTDNVDEQADLSHVHRRLRQQFGAYADYEIIWSGVFSYRSQCLDRLRSGSVFFIGDAAKVVSPFGARGGNSAIADADNLAWKLAAVLKGRAPAQLLDSYSEERHEAAEQNVKITNRTARFLRPADGMERVLRNAAISLARQHSFARPLINTGRMAVANTYTHSSICEHHGGQSVQNAGFTWADGSRGTLNDLLNWAEGDLLLLVFGDISAAAIQRLRELGLHAPVRSVQVIPPETAPQAREHIIDPQGHVQGACHVFGHAWALLRPDGYLAATGESVDAALVQSLEHALALTGESA